MKVLGRMRLRTENNCQAKDLVIVEDDANAEVIESINRLVDSLIKSQEKLDVSDVNQVGKELSNVLEKTLYPLIKIMGGKLDLDLGTHIQMTEINDKLDSIAGKSISDKIAKVQKTVKTAKRKE